MREVRIWWVELKMVWVVKIWLLLCIRVIRVLKIVDILEVVVKFVLVFFRLYIL